MPGPSDIRVNPFNNATNYVNLTERHIVPSVSPFVVRLNEVPEKQDPSNMQMYYVDDTTGQTTETALTEVAATPGVGEFRPDYSTNAFDDTSWNTGLIEFSSSDAGKIIEVSYTATGTLAGVKTNRYPAWWLDRGDGSDGDFAPESNVTISGLKQYKSVFIKAGVTVTVEKYCYLRCSESFVNCGNIKSDGQGATGGGGARKPDAAGASGAAGTIANGGAGGGGSAINNGGAGGAILVNNINLNIDAAKGWCAEQLKCLAYGAGGGGGGGCNTTITSGTTIGGNGGAGGGMIIIVCESFKNTGRVTSNGMQGGGSSTYGGGGGGGGGGSVIIITNNLIEQGTVTASGGEGGAVSGRFPGSRGANGGSGVVIIKEMGVL